ncbi:hypothetical protein CVT26_015074 [Gymnopilus dilepis]|uniref:TRP C-terminal domain-containing protein n=1 Tax=Gymnopilus dilepis TaxID=231916 RepID=A0A409WRV2_9AGAR|nr:hypothetical protein CVT26_015074 [Gymnopilus dilepis]
MVLSSLGLVLVLASTLSKANILSLTHSQIALRTRNHVVLRRPAAHLGNFVFTLTLVFEFSLNSDRLECNYQYATPFCQDPNAPVTFGFDHDPMSVYFPLTCYISAIGTSCLVHGKNQTISCVDALGTMSPAMPFNASNYDPSTTIVPSDSPAIVYAPSAAWHVFDSNLSCSASQILQSTSSVNASISFNYTGPSIVVNAVTSFTGGVFAVIVDGFETTNLVDTYKDAGPGLLELPTCFPLQFPPFALPPPNYAATINHTLTLVYKGPSANAPNGTNISMGVFDSFAIPLPTMGSVAANGVCTMAPKRKKLFSSSYAKSQGWAFQAVSTGSIPDNARFYLYSCGLISMCAIGFLIAAVHMSVRPLNIRAPAPGQNPVFEPEVVLIAEAISVDPSARTITMNWYPSFRTITCQNDPSNASVADIYVKSVLLDTSSPSWSSDLTDKPAYRLNNTERCQGLINLSGSFRTVTKLTPSRSFLNIQSISQRGSTFQDYPFDVYTAPFLFYVSKPNGTAITPLAISDSFGVAVNFQMSLIPTLNVIINGDQGVLQFSLRIERSMGTKAFVVLVAISNWLTATAFLIICAATMVYRHPKIYSEMFVVPVGALFAFSSIRANLPGAPTGFGAAIDLFTIIPVLVIMSFCVSPITAFITVRER